MVLYLAQPPHDADRHLIACDSKLFSEFTLPVIKLFEVHAKRYHTELPGAANSEGFANLESLLLAHDDNLVGAEPRQQSFDQYEHAGLCRTVVAVKDVTVKRVHDSAVARPKQKGRRR